MGTNPTADWLAWQIERGKEAGDLSSLENPESLDDIARAVGS